jgi:hypothetical protein
MLHGSNAAVVMFQMPAKKSLKGEEIPDPAL